VRLSLALISVRLLPVAYCTPTPVEILRRVIIESHLLLPSFCRLACGNLSLIVSSAIADREPISNGSKKTRFCESDEHYSVYSIRVESVLLPNECVPFLFQHLRPTCVLGLASPRWASFNLNSAALKPTLVFVFVNSTD